MTKKHAPTECRRSQSTECRWLGSPRLGPEASGFPSHTIRQIIGKTPSRALAWGYFLEVASAGSAPHLFLDPIGSAALFGQRCQEN